MSRAPVLVLVACVVLAGCAGLPTDTNAPGGDPQSPTPTDSSIVGTNGTLEVHFIHVGQSVATLVIGPTGETMLIDTGHFHDDGEHVLEYLQRHDVDRIDHLVTSHNDADHIGGHAAVIDYYETEADGVGAVYDPGIAASTQTYSDYLDAVERHDVTLYETREGDTIQFEGVDVQVLGPPEPYLESEARNENSIVLRLSFGQTSFLFPGDAEDDQEAYLVEEYGSSLESTVLKAGHHGSKSSSTGPFLDAVQPKAVLISSAYDSQYGHPSEEVLQRLAERSLTTYWTGTHGDVVFVSDGEQVVVETQQAGPTDPASLREGDAISPDSTAPVERRAVISGGGITDSTATPTAVVTDGGMQTATGTPAQDSLAVAEIHADAEGDDRENLNDEYVVFENMGDEPLDMSGWTVQDESGKTYTVPESFVLEAGATVTLHTGAGTDTDTALYWDAGRPVWNNGGDTVIVLDAEGEEVLQEGYS